MARHTVNLYIGADNQTGKIDLDQVARIASRDVAGFTLLPARGYWQGHGEPSAVLTVEADDDSLRALVSDLRTGLAQDAIGVQPSGSIAFVTADLPAGPPADALDAAHAAIARYERDKARGAVTFRDAYWQETYPTQDVQDREEARWARAHLHYLEGGRPGA